MVCLRARARKYGVTFGRRCCGLARPKRSQRKHNTFKGRALASLAWALAKLSVAPPQSAQPLLVQVPLPRSTLDSSPTKSPNHTELASRKTLLDVAATVRQIVLDVARERANGGTPQRSPRWIPAWSGHLLDTVAELVWYRTSSNYSAARVLVVALQCFKFKSGPIWSGKICFKTVRRDPAT
jgi:hypothetical protein